MEQIKRYPPSNGSPGALKQAQWFHTLIDYMETNGIEFAYWAMNGNEGNGYGILEKDWKTVDETLWNALKPYLGGDTSNPILYADP